MATINKQRVTVFVNPALAKHARAQAVVEETTLTDLVERALIRLSIEKQSYDLLTQEQKNSIKLYYKDDEEWKFIPLECRNYKGGWSKSGFRSFEIRSIRKNPRHNK